MAASILFPKNQLIQEPEVLGRPVPKDTTKVYAERITYTTVGERLTATFHYKGWQTFGTADLWNDDSLMTLVEKVREVSGASELSVVKAAERFWSYVVYQRGFLYRQKVLRQAFEEPAENSTCSPIHQIGDAVSIVCYHGCVRVVTKSNTQEADATSVLAVRNLSRWLVASHPNLLSQFWKAVADARLWLINQSKLQEAKEAKATPIHSSVPVAEPIIPAKGLFIRTQSDGTLLFYRDGKKMENIDGVYLMLSDGSPRMIFYPKPEEAQVTHLDVELPNSAPLPPPAPLTPEDSDPVIELMGEEGPPPALLGTHYHMLPGHYHQGGKTKAHVWALTEEEYQVWLKTKPSDICAFLCDYYCLKPDVVINIQGFRH